MSEEQTGASPVRRGRRNEQVGVVVSNRMTRSVVVEVERLVQHGKYRRVLRRRSRFMAHDEMGCRIGDKVRIVQTRPLSARKRWRVLEVLQKAATLERVEIELEDSIRRGESVAAEGV